MKWVMNDHVHYDRVASLWAIRRFVDPEAEISFAPRATPLEELPQDATLLGFHGVKLGMHDDEGTMFLKVLREYHLDDPALQLIEEVIKKGVEYVLHDYRPPADDRYGQMGVGLAAMADGMMILESSDAERLERSFVVWDAMYELFKANKQRGVAAPAD